MYQVAGISMPFRGILFPYDVDYPQLRMTSTDEVQPLSRAGSHGDASDDSRRQVGQVIRRCWRPDPAQRGEFRAPNLLLQGAGRCQEGSGSPTNSRRGS